MADQFSWKVMDDSVADRASITLDGVHSGEYLIFLRNIRGTVREVVRDRDTPLNHETIEDAIYMVKVAVEAAEYAWREKQTTLVLGGSFHHAHRNRESGFCILNGLAVAALNLLENHGVERIAILDTDVHAGDGTAEILAEDPRVLKISIHQDPRTLYPCWGHPMQAGHGVGEGYTVNIPLAKGAGWPEMKRALDQVVAPILLDFSPQILFRTGGCDMHSADPLSDLCLCRSDFLSIGRWVRLLTEYLGCARIEFLASGYNEDIQAQAWLLYLCGSLGIAPPVFPVLPPSKDQRQRQDRSGALDQTFAELRKALGWKWKCLEAPPNCG